ncbi:TFIID-18kDa-domain-containing protein [Tothia fuscella]|uniref:Transcription initiation factor TFIID subunit 13 n=1 Tax=Tothia fuscella TaxID=1048955 RepID=A0A9P4TVP5_9PEZI|nr:TFIID-18kDa-domain-containing protein [Tothia fuscella]
MEPRQRPRTTGQQWFPQDDLEAMLVAFGDDLKPLPETIRVLDSIITDYVIETCHEAESHARYSNRSKVKVDDFQFALRHDHKKLGRVQELLDMEKELKSKRKAFNVDEGNVGKDVAEEVIGAGGKGGKKRKGGSGGIGVGDGESTVGGGSRKGGKKARKGKSVLAGEGDEEEYE